MSTIYISSRGSSILPCEKRVDNSLLNCGPEAQLVEGSFWCRSGYSHCHRQGQQSLCCSERVPPYWHPPGSGHSGGWCHCVPPAPKRVRLENWQVGWPMVPSTTFDWTTDWEAEVAKGA